MAFANPAISVLRAAGQDEPWNRGRRFARPFRAFCRLFRGRERAFAEVVTDEVDYPNWDGLPMADHTDRAETMNMVLTMLREHFRECRDVFVACDLCCISD